MWKRWLSIRCFQFVEKAQREKLFSFHFSGGTFIRNLITAPVFHLNRWNDFNNNNNPHNEKKVLSFEIIFQNTHSQAELKMITARLPTRQLKYTGGALKMPVQLASCEWNAGRLGALVMPGTRHFQKLEVCLQADKLASGGVSKCKFGEVGLDWRLWMVLEWEAGIFKINALSQQEPAEVRRGGGDTASGRFSGGESNTVVDWLTFAKGFKWKFQRGEFQWSKVEVTKHMLKMVSVS